LGWQRGVVDCAKPICQRRMSAKFNNIMSLQQQKSSIELGLSFGEQKKCRILNFFSYELAF
jgi:hypothetical protein